MVVSDEVDLGIFDKITLAELRQRRSSKWRWYEPDILPAWIAELDVPLAEPIARTLHDAIDLGDTGYADPGELPAVFAGYAAAEWGWTVEPGSVALASDVMAGAEGVLRLVTEPGDGVVVNPPVYPPFFSTIADVGRQVVEAPLAVDGDGRWHLDLAALEAAFRAGARAYLLCSPHNPVGRIWSAPDLAAVAELADRYGVTVLSDEIHAPLTLPGGRHRPYPTVSPAAAAHGVVLTSASKAWNLAGLKCALVIPGGETMAAKLGALPEDMLDRVGHLGVLAAVAAFRDSGRWLAALRAHLDRNRRLLADLLAEQMGAVGYRPPEFGYLAWLDCRRLGLADDPAAVFRDRGRVALTPGPAFGTPGAGYARLNIGTSRTLVTEAVRRMAATLDQT